jgi:hypothetical protein
LDLAGYLQLELGQVWSPYGQRQLVKELLTSLLPGQRYDEAGLGLYTPPGTALAPPQLAAAIARMKPSIAIRPSLQAPGSRVLRDLIAELKSSGHRIVILLPPLHPAALEAAADYFSGADAIARSLAAEADIAVIDCRSVIAAGDFRDMDHLHAAGAAKFSRCVGAEVSRLLGGAGVIH